ncbi:hypothetical protein V1478_018759 [Vespula squamosa]|uniref:Uncharacterized protein n=1 Tax=Vespula squamosa TaxID=30214 RepID=A0ABD1ZTP3_VESSQ
MPFDEGPSVVPKSSRWKTVRVRDNVLGSVQVQIFELLTGSVFALLAPPPPSPPSALPPRPAPSSASNANRVHRAAATLAIENHQKLRAEFVCFRQISPWRTEALARSVN